MISTEGNQQRLAERAQGRLEALVNNLLTCRARLDEIAMFVEDNIDAPASVTNLMAAQATLRSLIETLATDCSTQFQNAHSEDLYM